MDRRRLNEFILFLNFAKRYHYPLLHSVAPTTVNMLNSGIGHVAGEWHAWTECVQPAKNAVAGFDALHFRCPARGRHCTLTAMIAIPKRRWFRFSLRTLFVLVTIIGAWLGYQLNWIRQRHEFLAARYRTIPAAWRSDLKPPEPPWQLRLLGEHRVNCLAVPKSQGPRARDLFPEAVIFTYPDAEQMSDSRGLTQFTPRWSTRCRPNRLL